MSGKFFPAGIPQLDILEGNRNEKAAERECGLRLYSDCVCPIVYNVLPLYFRSYSHIVHLLMHNN